MTFYTYNFTLKSIVRNYFRIKYFSISWRENVKQFYWKLKVSPTECDKTLTTSLSKEYKQQKIIKQIFGNQIAEKKSTMNKLHFIKFDIWRFLALEKIWAAFFFRNIFENLHLWMVYIVDVGGKLIKSNPKKTSLATEKWFKTQNQNSLLRLFSSKFSNSNRTNTY